MKIKALIVDDEKDVIEYMQSFLERFSVLVISSTKGKDAVPFYLEHKPDFVFLDIKMPDKDGIVVLKELRELDPQAKIIMITGEHEDEKKKKRAAAKYKPLDYINKPLDLFKLKEKLDKHFFKESK